jgi:parallel beta-helix repeat protein
LRSRFVGYVLVTLLVLNLFLVLVKIQPVQAQSTITILANGSIQPPTAPIQRTGSLYTLTENITFNNPGFTSAIRIERSNMTFDGNGCTLRNASNLCIYVIYATNVTIRNTTVIDSVSIGIYFYKCSNCTITQNSVSNCGPDTMRGAIDVSDSKGFKVTQNTVTGPRSVAINTLVAHAYDYHNISNNQIYNVSVGISLQSHDSIVQHNRIRNASSTGISVAGAQDTLFSNNNISDSGNGISLGSESQSDTISRNNINNCRHAGIWLTSGCQYTTITENNVTNTWGTIAGEGEGISVDGPFLNVVSKNTVINSTSDGISVVGDSQSVTDNYVANSGQNGIFVSGIPNNNYSSCYVSQNYVTNAKMAGISVHCNYTTISENTAVNNSLIGVSLSGMYHSEIFDNRILNNPRGFQLGYFGNNSIYHNRFTNNTQQVYSSLDVLVNSWDDGYPSGGNYWSDYTGVDAYKGPSQDIPGSDGIGDTPRVIALDNIDRYPRVSEPVPGALGVSPDYGGNTGNVTVRVTGSSFSQGMVVRLVRAGAVNVTGFQTTVTNSTQLTTTFNLAGLEPDTTWDLIVIYANGTELRLEYAFRILLGGEPIIYADIVGRHQLRIGHSSIYTVRVYNRGNVDATDQLITLSTEPALKILSVKDSIGRTVWNRTALRQAISDGQLQHPELWQGSSSQAVSEFLNTTMLYAPRIGAGDCLTLQVEVYAKIPWIGDDPIFLFVAEFVMEKTLTHILSQVISGELIFYGVDDLIAEQLRSGSYPVSSVEVTKKIVEFLLDRFGSSVSASVSTFGKWGVGALTGLGLALETAKKVAEHSKPEASTERPVQPVSSYDPNDKTGPTGYGTAVYVPADTNFTYVIYFENLANATAEAQNILITDALDTDLDWSTLAISGSSHPDTISYNFNVTTGTITWAFTGINLPPNINPPEGEGWVSYSIKPKAGLATSTEIRNKATIVFDVNPPIDTPEILHTIDSSPPESAIQSLPAQSNTSFTLNWSGADIGSGVKAYSIYYSDNDGPWVVWLLQTHETSATFNGKVGHTYRFYSKAIDQVGNWEEAPQEPDATTTAIYDNTPPETDLTVGIPRYVDIAETWYVISTTPFSLSATDNEEGSSGVASTTWRVHNSTYDSGWQTYSGSLHLNGLVDGNYSLEYRSTDHNSNVEIAKETKVVLDNKAPEASAVIDNGAAYTGSTIVTLQLTATDVLKDTIEVRFSNDNITYSEWEVYASTRMWNLTSGSGMKTCYVQFKDFLGSTSVRSDTIGLDTLPPEGSITINNGAAYTNSTSANLALSAVDAISGVAQMQFSNDNVTWSEWEAYATSKSWALIAGDGAKTVYVQYKDNLGLVSYIYQDNIVLDTIKPTAEAGQDQTVDTGAIVAFDASSSTDNIGIVNYEWNFGDSTTGSGQTTTHTYASAGTYTVTLTVRDAAGNTATDTTVITVLSTEAFPTTWIAGAAIAIIAIAAATILLMRRRKRTPN